MRQRKASTKPNVDSGFPQIRPNAAGLDIGSREHFVAVPEGRSTATVRSFGCTTSELREMAAWLKSCGVDTDTEVRREVRTFGTTTKELLDLFDWLSENDCTHVAMESTGVYWKPVWHILESGFELVLANAKHVRNLPAPDRRPMSATQSGWQNCWLTA